MTYNEWRDELKNNLLSVSDGERRRVLEYYAEAYADRRDAGFSEKEIIEEFGAPYDAAQRILSEEKEEDALETTSEAPKEEGKAEAISEPQTTPEPPKDEPKDVGLDLWEEPSQAPSSGAKRDKKHQAGARKAIIILSSVMGALFLLSLIWFIVGLAFNDWRIKPDYRTNEYTATADITSLKVEGTAGAIEVKLYDGEKVYVKYPTSKRFFVTVQEEGSALTVKGPKFTFPFWGLISLPDTVIMLPKDKVCSLDLSVAAGAIRVADGTFKDCRFEVSAGLLELGDLVCDRADIRISAGDIEMKSLTCPKVSIRISAGDFNGGSMTASDLDVNVSAGSATMRLEGKKEEYDIFVEKSAGSCNVHSQQGTTDKVLRIDISAGSVTVFFQN